MFYWNLIFSKVKENKDKFKTIVQMLYNKEIICHNLKFMMKSMFLK